MPAEVEVTVNERQNKGGCKVKKYTLQPLLIFNRSPYFGLPIWSAIWVFGVVALHPLRPKVAEIEEINHAVRWRKVRTLAIARCDTIRMQPVVSNYLKVKEVNIAIVVKV